MPCLHGPWRVSDAFPAPRWVRVPTALTHGFCKASPWTFCSFRVVCLSGDFWCLSYLVFSVLPMSGVMLDSCQPLFFHTLLICFVYITWLNHPAVWDVLTSPLLCSHCFFDRPWHPVPWDLPFSYWVLLLFNSYSLHPPASVSHQLFSIIYFCQQTS